jgi:hypothetical protein
MMKYEAYWISTRGTVVPVQHTHIETVSGDPRRFGLTTREIQAVYDKHSEKIPHEGYARAEIMAGLMKKGWIRIRHRKRGDSFTMELAGLTESAKRRLKKWASGITGKEAKVPICTGYQIIDILSGAEVGNSTLGQLVKNG